MTTVHIDNSREEISFAVIKSRRMRWAGHVVRMTKKAFRILMGKPQPLGRP
jgi:hypothetical protein